MSEQRRKIIQQSNRLEIIYHQKTWKRLHRYVFSKYMKFIFHISPSSSKSLLSCHAVFVTGSSRRLYCSTQPNTLTDQWESGVVWWKDLHTLLWLHFRRQVFRCHMATEDAFDVAFQIYVPNDLKKARQNDKNSLRIDFNLRRK